MDHRQLPLRARGAASLLWLVAALAASAPAVAGLYQWTDDQGRKHFSDRDPAGGAPLKSAGTAPSRGQPRFTVTVTPHGHDLSAAGRARLESGVQRIFAVYSEVFRLDMRRHVAVDIHLFPDEAELRAHLRTLDPQLDLPSGGIYGLYMPRFDAVFAWAHGEDEQAVIDTLWHEASHAMLDRLAPGAPPWLHEGLAEYFEGLQVRDGDARTVIAPVPESLAVIDSMVDQHAVIALRDYFALSPERWRRLAHEESNPIPYSVAWSVTYFLMSRPVGRQIVRELLHDLEKTGTSPTFDTIERRYPGGYTLMEYDWFKWAQQAKPPQVLAP